MFDFAFLQFARLDHLDHVLMIAVENITRLGKSAISPSHFFVVHYAVFFSSPNPDIAFAPTSMTTS